MNITRVALKHPMPFYMMAFFIILVGIFSYVFIGIQELPDVSLPKISVDIVLPGGSPSGINEEITLPVEKKLSAIKGLKNILSTSRSGVATLLLEFRSNSDIDQAYNNVLDNINLIANQFPTGTRHAVVKKVSDKMSLMTFALYGKMELKRLSKYVNGSIVPYFQQVKGVGDVSVVGAPVQALTVYLNNIKMSAYKITVADISNAFAKNHVQAPGGYFNDGQQKYSLDLNFKYKHIASISNMVIAYRRGRAIKLSDVADVRFANKENYSYANYNGMPVVAVIINGRYEENAVALSKRIHKLLNTTVKPVLPAGVKLAVVSDRSKVVSQEVSFLERGILLGVVSASLIVYLFLRSIRSADVIIFTLPVSLLLAIAILYLIGSTLNVVSLLALVVLVGLAIDDAIVMLENIYFRNRGVDFSHHRCVSAIAEMVPSVLSYSLIIILMFAPLLFLYGPLILFFKDLSTVLVVGVIASFLLSVSLLPALAYRLSYQGAKGRASGGQHVPVKFPFFSFYQKVLDISLRYRVIVIIIFSLFVLLGAYLFMQVGRNYIPQVSAYHKLSFHFKSPPGSSFQYMRKKFVALEKVVQQQVGVQTYFGSFQNNVGNLTVKLKAAVSNKINSRRIRRDIEGAARRIPGLQLRKKIPSISFSLVGADEYKVQSLSKVLYRKLSAKAYFKDLHLPPSYSKVKYKFNLDRLQMARLGISAHELISVLQTAGIGNVVAKFMPRGMAHQYDIVLKVDPSLIKNVEDLEHLNVFTRKGNIIQLGDLAKVVTAVGAAEINRFNHIYSVPFRLQTKDNLPLNKVVAAIDQTAASVLPKGYHVKFSGQVASMRKASYTTLYIFIFMLLLIFAVLASLFNSLLMPLLALATVPLSLCGGLLIIWLTGENLNIFSMIGMLLLVGLSAKNAILLLDKILLFRQQGRDKTTAIKQACLRRMRPVLMTSVVIIVAMLPEVLISGPASFINRSFSLVIIGGMIFSTLLTLILIPALYGSFTRGKVEV